MHAITAAGEAANGYATTSAGTSTWPDVVQDGHHESLRLRHLTRILIRNLSILPPKHHRLSKTAEFVDGAHASGTSNAAGPSRASGRIALDGRHLLRQRFSRDDSEVSYRYNGEGDEARSGDIPTLTRRRSVQTHSSLRRPRVSSRTASNATTLPDGVSRDSVTSSKGAPGVTQTELRKTNVDENGISSDQAALSKGHSYNMQPDDPDLVYGWMSASPPSLNRSKSDRSIRSVSSQRSSMQRRLFGRKSNKAMAKSVQTSDGEDDEDGFDNSVKVAHLQDPHSSSIPRHISFQAGERPLLPLDLHELQSSYNAFPAGRNRSASRGSILSLASASSGSTVRALPLVHTKFLAEHAKRRLRKHQDHTQDCSVCTRISLSIPCPHEVGYRDALSRAACACKRFPVYISDQHPKSCEPCFDLDDVNYCVSEQRQTALLAQDHFELDIWIDQSNNGPSSATTARSPKWQLLMQWNIHLNGLSNLGSDTTLFPDLLPHNSVILQFTTSDDYYLARPSQDSQDNLLDEEEEELQEDVEIELPDHAEETGNLSDPGPETFSRRVRRKATKRTELSDRERKRMLARARIMRDRSTRDGKSVAGIDDDQLRRLVKSERQLRESDRAVTILRAELDGLIANSPLSSLRQRDGQSASKDRRSIDLSAIRRNLGEQQSHLQTRRIAYRTRVKRLSEARAALSSSERNLAKSESEHKLDVNVLTSIQLTSAQRRASLISDLSDIFPIESLDNANLLFTVCGIALPSGNYEISSSVAPSNSIPMDDDTLSSGLGYIAQVVNLLATYLAVPLHYPLHCVGSRSLIQDPISQIKGTKVFPLYSKGVDRFRFDYALFLLNKDIEQLMLSHGMFVMDLAQTLPNLKHLYLTLTSDAPNQLVVPSGPAATQGEIIDTKDSFGDGDSLASASPSLSFTANPLQPQVKALGLQQTAGNPKVKLSQSTTSVALEKLLEASLLLGSRKVVRSNGVGR